MPLVEPDHDTMGAALAYAAAGWYVLPVSPRDRKNPGSVVGKGWPAKSSRDPHQIAAWFAGTSDLLALHCGRSGAVIFDVDAPELIPDSLALAIASTGAPHQSSRPNQPGRGHYVFGMPFGRMLGNSTGQLGSRWGEIRGRNGVVIAAPSRHQREDDGARYEWLQTGDVPALPHDLADRLPDSTGATDAVTDAEVERFLSEHSAASQPALATGPLTKFAALLADGGSRHEAAVKVACWVARESLVGVYSARQAFAALEQAFVDAMQGGRA